MGIAWSQTSTSQTIGSKRLWALTITPLTTKQTLDSVATAWAKDSIVLKFAKVEFNKNLLEKIQFSVDVTSGGHHASGKFSSENLQTVEIKADDGPGISIKGK